MTMEASVHRQPSNLSLPKMKPTLLLDPWIPKTSSFFFGSPKATFFQLAQSAPTEFRDNRASQVACSVCALLDC